MLIINQTERNKRWQHNNRDYSNYLSYRSTARNFIIKRATTEDLHELQELIDKRFEEENTNS
ncbi:hypothetical protein PUF88_03290 [Lactobacillaceae bacterium L1_55_11]|nr:hypothetical protein [Lactobacillaceae bacterium L1_55_11]